MTRIVVLLPPSEGKAVGGDEPRTPGVFGGLEPARKTVGKALRRRDFDATGQLHVGPVAARAAMAANRIADTSPAWPALRRYTGVLYAELGHATQPDELRTRVEESVVIVSGRWGLLRGDDAVPAYKLPIGATLPGLGRLAPWWRPRLTPVLADHVRGAVVWNLLPAAYAAALGPLPGAAAVWTLRVERETGGVRSVVGHDNKAVKGALTRAVVADGHEDPGALGGWSGPGGYRLDEVADGLVTVVARS